MEEIENLICLLNQKNEMESFHPTKSTKEELESKVKESKTNLIPLISNKNMFNTKTKFMKSETNLKLEKDYRKISTEEESNKIKLTSLPELFKPKKKSDTIRKKSKNLKNGNSELNEIFLKENAKYRQVLKNPNYPLMRYLDFRPYIDKLENRPKTPLDLGYYYKTNGNESILVRNLLEDNGFMEVNKGTAMNKEWLLLWSSGSIKNNTYSNLKNYQKVNHFPRSVELTRKDLLYKNLTKMKTMLPNLAKTLSFIPESFILPNEIKFLQEEMDKDPNGIWIVKPVSSSQGRGIYVTNNIQEIPSGVQLIVSRYVANPYLINGYKFDLRIYVLVTSLNPLRIYVFEEGFARFATEKFYMGQPFKMDKFMHLTNYAVNKLSKNFVPNTDPYSDNVGSKWSLSALKKYLNSIQVNWAEISNKIDDVVVKTIISAENNLLAAHNNCIFVKNSCFELFGFDILLDEFLNPWLMEVNLSPNLHCDSPIDVKIKGELIAEIFDLIRILPFDLREKEQQYSKYVTDTILESKILKELSHIDLVKDFKFTKEIREHLWDTDEEFRRMKSFRRVFPNQNSLSYRKFFIEENPMNLVLAMRELERYSNSTGNYDHEKKMKKVNLINYKNKNK